MTATSKRADGTVVIEESLCSKGLPCRSKPRGYPAGRVHGQKTLVEWPAGGKDRPFTAILKRKASKIRKKTRRGAAVSRYQWRWMRKTWAVPSNSTCDIVGGELESRCESKGENDPDKIR